MCLTYCAGSNPGRDGPRRREKNGAPEGRPEEPLRRNCLKPQGSPPALRTAGETGGAHPVQRCLEAVRRLAVGRDVQTFRAPVLLGTRRPTTMSTILYDT